MRLIHSAAGLCMMLLACSVHTETMAASQKGNVGAADAQERAGAGMRGRAIDRNRVEAASLSDMGKDVVNDTARKKDSDKIGPDGTIFLHDSEKQGNECEQRDAQAAMSGTRGEDVEQGDALKESAGRLTQDDGIHDYDC